MGKYAKMWTAVIALTVLAMLAAGAGKCGKTVSDAKGNQDNPAVSSEPDPLSLEQESEEFELPKLANQEDTSEASYEEQPLSEEGDSGDSGEDSGEEGGEESGDTTGGEKETGDEEVEEEWVEDEWEEE